MIFKLCIHIPNTTGGLSVVLLGSTILDIPQMDFSSSSLFQCKSLPSPVSSTVNQDYFPGSLVLDDFLSSTGITTLPTVNPNIVVLFN